MTYAPFHADWKDAPDATTPVTAAALEHIEGGIVAAHTLIATLEARNLVGTGSPEGVVSASVGAVYSRLDGGVGTTFYVKEFGSGNTGWTAYGAGQPATTPGSAPVNTVTPSITGTAREGQTLAVQPGTWTGSQPISYTYQWISCDAAGANPTDISGYTQSTYSPVVYDVGRTVKCRVTATNAYGTQTATTAASAVIAAASVVQEQLPDNLGFETDTSNWGPFFDCGTLSRTTTSPITGVGSGLITPAGGKTYVGVNRWNFALTAGVEYAVSFKVKVAEAGTYTPIVQDAAGNLTPAVGSNIVLGAGGTSSLITINFTPSSWTVGWELVFRLDRVGGATYDAADTVMFDDMSVATTGVGSGGGGGGNWPPPGAWFADDFTTTNPRPEWLWEFGGTGYGSNWAAFSAAGGGIITTDAGERVLRLRNPANFGGSGILSAAFLNASGAHGGYQNVGEVQWGRVRIKLDSAFVASQGTQNWLVEWHENFGVGINSLAIGLSAGSGGANPKWYIQLSGGPVSGHSYTLITDSGPDVAVNQWYDLLWEIKFHPDPAIGYFRLWINGVSKANVTRGTLLTSGGVVDYCSFGLYLYRLPVVTEGLVYFDKMAMGPTRASIGA